MKLPPAAASTLLGLASFVAAAPRSAAPIANSPRRFRSLFGVAEVRDVCSPRIATIYVDPLRCGTAITEPPGGPGTSSFVTNRARPSAAGTQRRPRRKRSIRPPERSAQLLRLRAALQTARHPPLGEHSRN